ncbi:MAG TPA: porin family protein [Longimicrobiales bacterium]
MKKWTMVLTAVVFAAALPRVGQAQGLSLGVKAGVNMANFTGDDAPDTDMRTGFTAGAYLRLSTPGMFAIQPEVLFSQKGAQQSFDFGAGPVDASWNTTYVEIPVLLRIGVPMPASPVKPFVFAGPSAGFLLSSKIKAESDDESAEVDFKDSTKSTDWGAVVGAGLDFGSLSVDLRANLGLSSLSDIDDDVDMKNRTFTVMLGYQLPLGM